MTVAFALSGGGNLGPMQAGTVLSLMEHGIEPDLLVGTSVGALNAAFLSTRPGVDGARDLMAAWSGLGRRQAVRFSPLTALAGFLGYRDHLVSNQQIRRLIKQWVPIRRIEDATIPFAVTATDAVTGEGISLARGDLVDALTASAAIPGLFPPVRIDGRWLVDGSLAANYPVLEAQELGADDIYVITTATAPRVAPPRGAVAVAMNSVSLVTAQVSQRQLADAMRAASARGGRVQVVPSAEPAAPGTFDFRRSTQLAESAYRRTSSWLAEGVFH
jgi:NTE family protein